MYKTIAINWSIEFGPIAAFFVALWLLGATDKGFIQSTGIFTALTAVALFVSYVRERRIAWFPLIAGLSVIFFGVITLVSQNPLFFIVKDTAYNGLFGIVLLVGTLFKKGLLKPLFASLFDMSDRGWFILSVRWGVFFVLLAIFNEISWREYGRDAWVLYKFWSTIGTVVFGFYQIKLSRKYRNEGSSPWGMRITSISQIKFPH